MAAEEGFFTAIEDLPLMPGMVEKVDDATVFDTPEGRVILTTATVQANKEQVVTFYRQALLGLGWEPFPQTPIIYARDNETLLIEVAQEGNTATVRFHINPKVKQ